jgi:flagella basal body P-ring formation protein FlgA
MRKFLILALLCAPALAAANEPRLPEGVQLKAHVSVESAVVRLGDVFTGVGAQADTVLGNAPEPGETVTLPGSWLGRVAEHYDLDWQAMPGSQSVVERAARVIEEDELAEALRSALVDLGAPARLRVTLDQRSLRLVLPADTQGAVRVDRLDHDRRNGRFQARLSVGEGRAAEQVRVSGRAVAVVDVPVLARRIERGAVIQERDIAWLEQPETALRRGDITDSAALIGQAARRSLRPDTPLSARDVEAPVVVARNSLVTLRLTAGYMALSARGRALADGAVGETVRVLNTKSKTTVSGIVRPDGSVAVQIARN